MLPKDLIKRVRKLEIRTRKVVSDMLAGQYHSVFKGRGMAFSEVRPYYPGDEIRFIDWNVTARTGDPYVKIFSEERELTVILVVDVSASESFGSVRRTKAELAAEIAAQIAFSAIANNDRVGLLLFTDQVEKVVPARKGRSHVLRLITDILTHKPAHLRTDIGQGLHFLSNVAKRKAVVFLISDFLSPDFEKPLRIAARRHDLVPVVVGDPMERVFPDVGLVELEDPESGERMLVDTSSAKVRGDFARVLAGARDTRNTLFKRLGLDFLELDVGQEQGMALAKFFRMRARRMRA